MKLLYEKPECRSHYNGLILVIQASRQITKEIINQNIIIRKNSNYTCWSWTSEFTATLQTSQAYLINFDGCGSPKSEGSGRTKDPFARIK